MFIRKLGAARSSFEGGVGAERGVGALDVVSLAKV
jgi:hypothetical protein